jgi:hypothetical protein
MLNNMPVLALLFFKNVRHPILHDSTSGSIVNAYECLETEPSFLNQGCLGLLPYSFCHWPLLYLLLMKH